MAKMNWERANVRDKMRSLGPSEYTPWPSKQAVKTVKPARSCPATTAKGTPCAGGVKKGSRFCGPHHDKNKLAQKRRRDSKGR